MGDQGSKSAAWEVEPEPAPDVGCASRDEDAGPDTQRTAIASSPRLVDRPPVRRCATLWVVQGHESGRVFALPTERSVLVGRSPRAELRMADPTVSRQHASIEPDGRGHLIRDLGSANGTFLEGVRVTTPRTLRAGHRIELGDRVVLRFDRHDTKEQEILLRLYRFSVRDPLTGLYDRAYFHDRLEAECSYALRHGTQVAVLMVDIDHFKHVNDQYGHPAGDAALRVVAATMKRMVRPEDVLARYGGEEFAVLARNLDARNAVILADRLRRSVAGLRPAWKQHLLPLTISVGVASLEGDGGACSPDELIAAADAALYESKDAGRNRVVHASALRPQ
ncbi:MAG: GGDEF domain-containing protein [Myxococcota bacterium]